MEIISISGGSYEKGDIKKVAKLLDDYFEVRNDYFHPFVSFMERMGWKTIEYNDNGPGDEFVKKMGLELSASKYPAFLYTGGGRNIILVDSTHQDKIYNFGHEMGHIF